MKKVWNILLLLPLLLLFLSCEEQVLTEQELQALEQQKETEALKQEVFRAMHEWYLWNDLIPEVDIADYATAEELMAAMMYRPLDRWSYIQSEEAYNALFERGEYEGYGFRMAYDPEGNLRVAFVYTNSPFGRAGVQRSWIIDKIDGKSVRQLGTAGAVNAALEGATHNFELIKSDGSRITEQVSKTTITMNTVLTDRIFDVNEKKVGYLVFNSFLATSQEELQSSFQKFKDAAIDELIVDLRYNGGGRVNIAEWMASNILGGQGVGKNFINYTFNASKMEQNRVEPFLEAEIPLDLQRVFFITSGESASASELLINGLRPFMETNLIGDNTYGKPVGSFRIPFEGYAINPISFKVLNDQGVGEYYEGLPADAYVADDLSHDLGDPEESRLKEALYYIENGSFSGAIARQSPAQSTQQIELTGFRREIGAF